MSAITVKIGGIPVLFLTLLGRFPWYIDRYRSLSGPGIGYDKNKEQEFMRKHILKEKNMI